MKKILSLTALLLVAGAFSASQLSAQETHQPPPPPGEIVVSIVTGGTGGQPGAPSQTQIAITTGGGTVTVNVGSSKADVVQALGSPMIVSILEAAGLIAFDASGNLIPGPALTNPGGGTSAPANTNGGVGR